MKNSYSKFYNWLSELAETKWGPAFLFLSAFADASFLPLPVTTFFIILLFMNTGKVFRYFAYVILGTLLGSLGGYLIGHYGWLKPNGEFTGVVQFLFDKIPGFSVDLYSRVHDMFVKWDFWILCSAAATPIPFGIFSITSGIFNINIFIFIFSILISQGIKFSLIALFTVKLGPNFRKLIQINWKPVAIVTTLSAVVVVVIRVL
jgi:membrane protein YqaA with SNARE-associated domain